MLNVELHGSECSMKSLFLITVLPEIIFRHPYFSVFLSMKALYWNLFSFENHLVWKSYTNWKQQLRSLKLLI